MWAHEAFEAHGLYLFFMLHKLNDCVEAYANVCNFFSLMATWRMEMMTEFKSIVC
jgi:hypothetical protein